ncbi:cupin-like domain-containing protein [Acinetobacter tianfuensis]|uniref:cupin-like domain-containing protein n=1 Tax=Acinetobacter tianfuensis TaxID=2419603 RepID=UPI001D1922D4|nr:cupin-like domain-containing protein [Acinetobacter tianfuensis]
MNHQQMLKLEQAGQVWLQQLPQDWQIWLEQNLQRGCSEEQLMAVLKQHGLAPSQVFEPGDIDIDQSLREFVLERSLAGDGGAEIIADGMAKGWPAAQIEETYLDLTVDPVFRKLLQTQQKLNKCSWMMRTQDRLRQLQPNYAAQIERKSVPGFSEFVQQHYSLQVPVILLHGIEHWPARHQWSPEYFAAHFPEQMIEVQMHRQSDPNFERNSPQLKRLTLMRDFISKLMAVQYSNDMYLTANNAAQNKLLMQALQKDIADFGTGYCDLTQSERQFLWMGPAGTFTPLHYDLTNNMLVQLYGRKKVTLIPALQMPDMYNHCWVFSELNCLDNADLKQYPQLQHVTPLECVLEPGEALFIPIGWWHSVESLDVSISLSFTNFNQMNQFYNEYPSDLIK